MSASSDSGPAPETVGLRERGKQRRTSRILDAALEMLREDPSQPLTMERIAERAEVAPMTVYNLVGNREQLWLALVDRALGDLDVGAIAGADPHERARRIVDAVVRTLRADAAVFSSLLSGWRGTARVLAQDPTEAFVECLRDAAATGQASSEVNVRRHAEVLAAGLVGTILQWTAGLLSDRAFAARARAVVDVVFAAARNGDPVAGG